MKYLYSLVFFIPILLNTTFAESSSYSVSPSKIEGSIPAGQHYENVFTIKNPSDNPITINVMFLERTINPLDKNWFTLDKNQVDVPAGESSEIKYSISIPDGSEGEYDARVIFSKDPTAKIMGISIRYNFPVYIIVSGTEKYDFSIEDINITNKSNTEISINMTNTGNVHIRPKGTIKIVSKDTEYSMIFNKRKWAIIPNEKYRYTDKFKDPMILSDGDYIAKINILAGTEDKRKPWSDEIAFTVKDSVATIISDKKSVDTN